MKDASPTHTRVLLLAPAGRDAHLAANALERAGILPFVCRDAPTFCAELAKGAAAGLITEEAIAPGIRQQMIKVLEAQPLWSDLPILVVASRPPTARGRLLLAAAVAELGNAIVLERPLDPDTMVGAVRSSLRARDRQYQARQLLHQLEEGVKERDRFLATLSHELRNPLGAIRSATEVMSRVVPKREEIERPLGILMRQTRHVARLIDDLLEVSRVTTGKVVLQMRILDLRTAVRQVVEQLEPSAAEQGLTIRSSVALRPIWVHADPVRMEQVFTNLLTNAIKYTPKGGQIDVVVDSVDQMGRVRVADNGIGIALDMLPSVFQMFAQADRSLDRSQGGLGIGLSLVQSLLILHNGTVAVHSEGPNRGSEFTVTLPMMGGEGETTEEPVVSSVAASSRKAHVLLVEDNDDNREVLQELLELEGYRVDVARDGTAGVEQALALKPDVAIVDLGLPGISGYEVARQLRQAMGARIALIALTGYGQPEDRQRTMDAGFDAHLTKPVGYPELEAMLRGRAGPAGTASGGRRSKPAAD